jgi:hypothetical protein
MEMLRHFAARHGASVAEEVRRAIRVHVVASMLDALDDPEFVAQIAEHRTDFDLDAYRARTKQDLAKARRAALGHKGVAVDDYAALLAGAGR